MTENRRIILKLKELLKKKKFVIGIPVVIKLKMIKPKEFKSFKAKKGEEVVKWKDILKVFKNIK